MTANNFIREFAIKIFSEAARTENELYYKVLNQDKNFKIENFQNDSDVAWFLGEFCDNILQEYFIETARENDFSWEKVYLIEGKHVLETIVFGLDCYNKLDWKFVEKKTKMIEVTEWTESS